MKISKLINLALLISVISGTFLVLEYFIEDYLITKTPIKFHFSLPPGLSVLAQSSKSERIPKNYIAIVGDSYAQGKGDWLLEIDPSSNAAFHSAHALQKLTGRDIVSFGKSGASNVKGWVREPIARYQFIHNNIDDSFKQPEIILAYFYAGNDLLENVSQIRESFIPKYGEPALNDDDTWNEFFLNSIAKRKMGPFNNNSNLGWLPRATFKVIKNELKTKKVGEELGDIHIQHTGKTNSVWVKNEEIKIPDNLQSPGMELSDKETNLGFLTYTKSLKYLKKFFNKSQIIVVYIPSVVESYDKVSKLISISNIITKDASKHEEIHNASKLMQRSDEISGRVKSIAESLDLSFIDTRRDIRAASTEQLIHGPIDWKHYNRRGYETLAQSIVCQMVEKKLLTNTSCPLKKPDTDPAI